MNNIVSLLILAVVFSLCACTSGGMGNYGYWVNEKPYKGTSDKNKFFTNPYWKCVNTFPPHTNKEC